MAGHRKGEKTYFVPRTEVPLENSVEWYSKKLLPKLEEWRRESASRQGDKTTCCDTFLNDIVPYFVEILVQDGIYFVKDFPMHPVSHLLKVSFLLCV